MKLDLNAKALKQSIQEPLYKNALFLMITAGVTSILGFVFWIIVARFYSPSEVGLATALISAVGLLGIFSQLGFQFGLVRYLPGENDKKGMINSSLTIVGLFSLLLVMIFVAGLGFWSPALLFIQKDAALFLSFVIFTAIYSLYMLQSSGFVGIRSAKFSLLQSITAGLLKIPLPLALVSFGVLGIFASWGLATGGALIVALLFLLPRVITKYYPVPTIKKKLINKMIHFSAGNYVAEIFACLPALLLPLMIVNLLTEEMSAYFFIAWTIANILFMIPLATTVSLLAEGSYEPERFRYGVIRAIRLTFILLIPAVLVIFFLGDKILLLFGREYSESAVELLRILALSSIPFAVREVYVTVKRVQLKIRPIIAIYAFIAIGTLVASYRLMPGTGLRGIGLAWISTQVIVAAIVGWSMTRKGRWLRA